MTLTENPKGNIAGHREGEVAYSIPRHDLLRAWIGLGMGIESNMAQSVIDILRAGVLHEKQGDGRGKHGQRRDRHDDAGEHGTRLVVHQLTIACHE